MAAKSEQLAFLKAVTSFLTTSFAWHILVAKSLGCYSSHLWNECRKITAQCDLERI